MESAAKHANAEQRKREEKPEGPEKEKKLGEDGARKASAV
jgi:hypothetical protein